MKTRFYNVVSVLLVEIFGLALQGTSNSKNDNNQRRIFERFFRAEGKNENTFPGFGIGLFIANEIVKGHGGNIEVKSKPGSGAEFFFSLNQVGPLK